MDCCAFWICFVPRIDFNVLIVLLHVGDLGGAGENGLFES